MIQYPINPFLLGQPQLLFFEELQLVTPIMISNNNINAILCIFFIKLDS